MNLEKQKEIEDLMKVLHPDDSIHDTNARLLGMCKAMLTDEQLDKMISYIKQWIEEK